MKKYFIEKLSNLANHLDANNLVKEADELDEILRAFAFEEFFEAEMSAGLISPTGIVSAPTVNKATIIEAQKKLQSLGYSLPRYGADGIIGRETRSALLTFQSNNNIPQTGKLDDQTIAKLNVSEPTTNTNNSHETEENLAIKGRERPSDIEVTRLYKLTQAEVGSQGSYAQQAFMETVFNRAAYRGVSINTVVSNDRYYSPLMRLESRLVDDLPDVSSSVRSAYDEVLRKVLEGSNITNGATHNASGSVAKRWDTRFDGQAGSRIDIAGSPSNPSINREYNEDKSPKNWRAETFYSKTYEQRKLREKGIVR